MRERPALHWIIGKSPGRIGPVDGPVLHTWRAAQARPKAAPVSSTATSDRVYGLSDAYSTLSLSGTDCSGPIFKGLRLTIPTERTQCAGHVLSVCSQLQVVLVQNLFVDG